MPVTAPRLSACALRARLAWFGGVAAVFAAAYWLANRLTSLRSDVGHGVFEWERGIPFVAWTIVPYLSICAFFVLSFFVGRDAGEVPRHGRRLLLALVVSLLCYAAFPLRFHFERPATDGLPGLLFDLLSAFDLPFNRAPSLHVSVLVILWAQLRPHADGVWRLALAAWFVLIGLSVLTTYQHHVIDVPAGLLVGALCVAAGRRSFTVTRYARLGRLLPRGPEPS